jgi:hypothetical protein
MKLPNANRAIIDLAKLRDYCLNPRHAPGPHNASIGPARRRRRMKLAQRFIAGITANRHTGSPVGTTEGHRSP